MEGFFEVFFFLKKRKDEFEKYQKFQLAWYMIWMSVHNWLKAEESFSTLMSSHFLPH